MSFTSRQRDLAVVITAKAVSLLGDELATVALLLRLQPRGAGAVAAVLIANLAPIVLLAPVVGRAVDRYDNRRLLVGSSVAQALVCAVLAFTSAPTAALPLVALLGAGQAVNGATWQALLPALAGPGGIARVTGLAQATTTVAGIAAPALGGLLVGSYGPRVPLLIDAASFLAITVAGLALRAGRVGTAPDDGARHGGLAIVRRDPLLRSMLTALGLFVALGSLVNVADVFLIRETLHAGTTWYGLFGAAWMTGLLGGSLLAGRIAGLSGHARAFVFVTAALGIVLAGISLVPDVAWLLAVAVVGGVLNGVLSVNATTLVMSVTAPAERGRVGALLGAVVSGAQLGAYAAGGLLAGWLTPREIFLVAGVLGVLAPLLLGPGVLRQAARRSEAGRSVSSVGADAHARP